MTIAAPRTVASPSGLTMATGWMMIAVFSFIAMAVAGRVLTQELPTIELIFFRSLLQMIVVSAIAMASKGGLGQLRTQRIGMHAARSLSQLGGQFGWFYGLSLIPLAQVFALEFTAPLWVAVLAPFLLGERFTLPRLLAAVVGFGGVLVVLRPVGMTIETGSISVLLGAVGFALSAITIKLLTRTESPLSILFYMGAIQWPVALVLSIPTWVTPSPTAALFLLVVTGTAMTSHYCLARAFKLADAIVVAPLDFLRLPLVAVVGWLLYSEPFDPLVLAGGALVLAGNFINVLAERAARSRARTVSSSS